MFLLRPTFFLCLLFACLSLAPIASAQENQIKTFTTRDGLAGNYVTAIAFARDDSVWVGTTEGVTHIEPNRWTSYTRAHGLGDSWITAIATAPDERVWFGTQSGGVSVLDPISKTLTTYNLDNSDIPSNFVTSLAIDSQNKIWAGTLNNGVAQFDAETKQWNRRALPKTNITTVTRGFDAQGTLWAIADGHVYALQNERWELRELSNSELAIRLFDDHRQMVAVTPERMYIWNGAAWERYTPMPHVSPLIGVLDEEQVTAQSGSGNDDLWYGTANGLYVIDSPQWLKPQNPLPVLVIHGWTVAGNDTLESSEFRFLKSYADRDGIPMYYVRGVSPKNTLYQNAQVIRDEIARVKKETGAEGILRARMLTYRPTV